jgi:uncharacterized paraquat-inducible protein A
MGKTAVLTRSRTANEADGQQSPRIGICARCGLNFEVSRGKHNQQFCSDRCRKKSWVSRHAPLGAVADLKRKVAELEKRILKLEHTTL